ncbi:MAG: hypothetical protein K2G87_10285, partial [Oscillospiraceae bacterium]|nr:hypothetical protein [Oscillospiraceae bacterium]
IVLIVTVLAIPAVRAFAADTELIVEYSADENGVKLNWRTDEKNVIEKSTVYRYDPETKSFLKIARTDKSEYADNDVHLTARSSVRYKIIVSFEHGGKASKTVDCYTLLPDIPLRYDSQNEGRICKAYVYMGGINNGSYPIIYHNFFGDIIIGETDSYLNNFAASEDGKTVFYSTKNEVYRYCVNEGKAERIFRSNDEIGDIETSPNGKCIFFTNDHENSSDKFVWYEQKLYQLVLNDYLYYIEAVCDDGKVIFSALDDNDDEEIYFYCLYEFDPETEKYKRFAKMEYDGSYVYDTAVFPDENVYALYDVDYGLYCGTIGSKPRKLLPAEECYTVMFVSNGKTAFLSDDKNIYRIDLESGKKTAVAEINPNLSDRDSLNFKYNADFSAVLFIDYGNNLLVRASEWDDDSCTYTKRQEIPINVTADIQIYDTSNDMNIVCFYDGNKDFIAFFQNGGIKYAKNILGSDAYDRMFCYESREEIYGRYYRYKNLMIAEPDGSTSVVYNGYFFFPEWENTNEKIPMMICLTEYLFDDEYRHYYANSSDVYFTDKSGKAVFVWHENYDYAVVE